jgi:hypothetical protein
MTCDDYQIAFDQQHAGVSSAIASAAFDAHVAACAGCTAYVSLSEKVSNAMMTTLSRSPAPLDAGAILDRVADYRRRMTRSLVAFSVVVGVVMLGYFVVVRGFSLRGLIASLVGAVVGASVGYGVLMLMFRRRLADLKALETQSGEALVVGLRAELDRRIRTERQNWWVLPIILVGFHLMFVGLAAPSLPYLIFEICYLAIPLPISITRYRRLVRERALLAT